MAKKPSKTAQAGKTAKAGKTASAPAPAPVVTEVASVATKLTKRSTVKVSDKLDATGKVPKNRTEHTKAAWEAVAAILPNTIAELVKLEPLAHPDCKSPQAYLSYMIRRGALKVAG
jgi:hypothetical protein